MLILIPNSSATIVLNTSKLLLYTKRGIFYRALVLFHFPQALPDFYYLKKEPATFSVFSVKFISKVEYSFSTGFYFEKS